MSDIPIGSIVAMLQSPKSPPADWLLCDGSSCPSQYLNNLKNYLNDGKTLPNLQGYTLIGAGTSYPAQTQTGATTASHKLTEEEMPSHQHFGWGESGNSPWGFGQTSNKSNYGSHSDDSDNHLYGSTWAGGIGGAQIPLSDGSYTFGSHSDNSPFSIDIMQPSFAVYYFIYAGPGQEC